MTKKQEYMKRWREKNKERLLEYSKQYDDANREKRRLACRNWYANQSDEMYQKRLEDSYKWREVNHEKYLDSLSKSYQKHKPKILAAQKKYTSENEDAVKARKKAYRASNKTAIREGKKRWYLLNKHIAIAGANRRRVSILKASTGNPNTILTWEKSWRNKDVVRCYWCLDEFHPSLCAADHIHALSLGGSHSIENLCISCKACNSSKSFKSVSKWNSEIQSPTLGF
jgi:5-methylcytosine-specific restriction endonuclease McrA